MSHCIKVTRTRGEQLCPNLKLTDFVLSVIRGQKFNRRQNFIRVESSLHVIDIHRLSAVSMLKRNMNTLSRVYYLEF